MLNILVTDGDTRSALAVTRSLCRKGHKIFVTSSKKKSIGSCSRFCKKGIVVPDPLYFCEDYIKAISEIAWQKNIDIIFPMTEHSIYLLNQARASLPQKSILACADQDIMEIVSNKYGLFKLAEDLKVAIPKTFYLDGNKDLSKIINDINEYPVVIKPAFSKVQDKGGFMSGGVKYARDQAELAMIYDSTPILQYPSIIQEKIEGSGTGLFTLYDRNRHIALFSHRRLREKPPSGGVSVVCESVPLDDEMVRAADRLLATAGFCGVAMVEFKRDSRDGSAKLMEINGRFWGSLQLAIACGVDFPSLYLDYLYGKLTSYHDNNYVLGRKLKWFLGTLDHMLIQMRVGDTKKLKALGDFLYIWERNTSFDVACYSDMRPFLHEVVSYINALWKKT